MAPTRRAAAMLLGIGFSALLLPAPVVAAAIAALAISTGIDAWVSRGLPALSRTVPDVLSRGVPAPVRIVPDRPSSRIWVRQPTPPDLRAAPPEQGGGLDGTLTALRRGRHTLDPFAVRSVGPLRLGQSLHRAGEAGEVSVFPDMVAARRLASLVQHGTFALEGRRRRGPIGLGTEFESIRAYVPGDDIRQVNWAATARSDQPMVNQWRLEQDRDVICLVDAGRLMAAPIGDRTRMDAAVDVAAAVAAVADVVGDRAGVVVFRNEIERSLPPSHRAGTAVAEAIFDVEPAPVESDYLLAFQHVASRKRALVVVLTDILDESAARPLSDAIGVLARRHSVVVGSVRDPDLAEALGGEVGNLEDVARAAVALDVLGSRRQVVAGLRRHGAVVIESPPSELSAGVVAAYLRAKSLARF